MDTGRGNFVPIINEMDLKQKQNIFKQHGGLFHVGETVELKGSRFRIKSIKPKELRLKLLLKD